MTPKLKDVPNVTELTGTAVQGSLLLSFLDSKFSNLGGNVIL